MPIQIEWAVTVETHARIAMLTSQMHNMAITEAQWLDEVMRLPGYPLRGKPTPAETLVIIIKRPTVVPVHNRLIHTEH